MHMINSEQDNGILYLIPTPLTPYSQALWEPGRIRNRIAPAIIDCLQNINYFVVESEKTATRFLSRILSAERFAGISFFLLDEHSTQEDLELPLGILQKGKNCAILSEAGLPCIADPGAALVAAAHRYRIPVIPMGGESSILLALSASGLNGQNFCFLGYLPIEQNAFRAFLSAKAEDAIHDHAARIFIETPYRNERTLHACLSVLPETLQLCFAGALGTDSPCIISKTVAEWKIASQMLPEIPAVFCFGMSMILPQRETRKNRSCLQRK